MLVWVDPGTSALDRVTFVRVIRLLCEASAYEKGVPGVPGSPLSDLKPLGLWRHLEALRGSLKPSETR